MKTIAIIASVTITVTYLFAPLAIGLVERLKYVGVLLGQ